MKSLDEILSENAVTKYQDRLDVLMDVQLWTTDNRDQMLSEIQKVSDEVCGDAVLYTMQILEKEVDGQSVLYWQLRNQFLAGTLEFLLHLRASLDTMDEQQMAERPQLSYDWLTAKIRDLCEQIQKNQDSVEGLLNTLSRSLDSSRVAEL